MTVGTAARRAIFHSNHLARARTGRRCGDRWRPVRLGRVNGIFPAFDQVCTIPDRVGTHPVRSDPRIRSWRRTMLRGRIRQRKPAPAASQADAPAEPLGRAADDPRGACRSGAATRCRPAAKLPSSFMPGIVRAFGSCRNKAPGDPGIVTGTNMRIGPYHSAPDQWRRQADSAERVAVGDRHDLPHGRFAIRRFVIRSQHRRGRPHRRSARRQGQDQKAPGRDERQMAPARRPRETR